MFFSAQQIDGFKGFAIIVDINGFSSMVKRSDGDGIADNVRDVLYGSVHAVESHNGVVVGFMGDAILGFLENVESTYACCASIARDVDRMREYLLPHRDIFPFPDEGPGLKIGVEYGTIDVAKIQSRYLGQQELFIGMPINYASRITGAGKGNRCNIGPRAYEMGLKDYRVEGPYTVDGKPGEGTYTYYQLDLGDIWQVDSLEEYFWI